MYRERNAVDLPRTIHWPFDVWPERIRSGDITMEFRLVYDGRLPAASRSETRNPDKDRIRRVFSKQLAELFATHPALRSWLDKEEDTENFSSENERIRAYMKRGEKYSMVDLLGAKYERCGQKYVPLISSPYGVACSLDILFLRRDQPGNLIVSGGDLDNRIKVLFDALRLPQNCDEVLPATSDAEREELLYVLLEDDRLIVDVKVTSDRLLTPRRDDEHMNDVRLIIHVKSVVTDATKMSAVLF